MAKRPDIQRLIQLQQLVLDFQAIDRKVAIPPATDRPENDVEHSYSLAMLAWFLAPHFPKLDRDRILCLALAHDMVEVHAGDTFVYDNEVEVLAKPHREKQAMARLARDWHDFPALLENLQEYTERSSEEAKFVYALDKLQVAIMDYLNKGRLWHKHGITLAKFMTEKEKKIPISPEIAKYYREFLTILKEQPGLFPPD